MKIKLGKAVDAHDALKAIKEANDLPVLIAWAMGDWFVELAPVAQRFNDQQNELAKKFGKPDPKDSRQFMIPPAKIEAFTAELNKLRAVEVDLKDQNKLVLDELKECGIKIPPAADLIAMRLFIQ